MNVLNNCSAPEVPLFLVESRIAWNRVISNRISHVSPPSALFFFSFCSTFLCKLLLAPPCLHPPKLLLLCFVLSLSPLLPLCTLWYADMQEFLGLKMIDQTCQPWLLLLKMAALALCVLVIGASWSYFPCDWAPLVCLRLTCCWQKCEFNLFCLFRSKVLCDRRQWHSFNPFGLKYTGGYIFVCLFFLLWLLSGSPRLFVFSHVNHFEKTYVMLPELAWADVGDLHMSIFGKRDKAVLSLYPHFVRNLPVFFKLIGTGVWHVHLLQDMVLH